MIYTHVATVGALGVTSPLDEMAATHPVEATPAAAHPDNPGSNPAARESTRPRRTAITKPGRWCRLRAWARHSAVFAVTALLAGWRR